MHRSFPLVAALFIVLAMSAARAEDITSDAVLDIASNEVSLPTDFTGDGGVGGTKSDPSGGGGMMIQLVPASDTGISNAPSNFHYVRSAGH